MNARIPESMYLIWILALASLPLRAADPSYPHWPSFRGRRAAGVADGPATPTRWNVEEGENVAWRTPVPGLGLSSPVIWGDRIFVTTAVSEKGEEKLKPGLYGAIKPVDDSSRHDWELICFDKKTGGIRWQRTVHSGVPRIKRHPKSSHANSTPATDGDRVVAFFGSEGLFCYTVKGELVWSKDLGVLDAGYYRVPSAQWGFGSSPVIHEEKVIVQCDIQDGGFVAAFDVRTGKEIWRTGRDDVPTWSTPAVHVGPERSQVIVNGYRHIGGYALATGKELWRMTGGGDIPVPTPILGPDLVYITNSHGRMRPIYAVRLSARGDVTLGKNEGANTHVAWSYRHRGNYMQTPILVVGLLYCCSDRGVLGCYDARTGEQKYLQRVGLGASGFTASPISSGDSIYLTSENGEVHVVRAGPKFQTITVNRLDETCLATPAISEGRLYFRGRSHLIAIGR